MFIHPVGLRDLDSGQSLRTLSGHTRSVFSVAFSPDGALLDSASCDRTVKLWHVASGRFLRTSAEQADRTNCQRSRSKLVFHSFARIVILISVITLVSAFWGGRLTVQCWPAAVMWLISVTRLGSELEQEPLIEGQR
jgi:WD40 repeat protein